MFHHFLNLLRVAPILLFLPAATADTHPLPLLLSETGLFVPGTQEVSPENIAFTPQYPLWSDGASKRRWLYLPPGKAIDASNPDAWIFPRGTKLWKEFAFARAVETRLIERLKDGSWRFAVYAWEEDGSDAYLVAEAGARLFVHDAPGKQYEIPSREDCTACHGAAPMPVLGLSAIQLSNVNENEHDGLDLEALQARGLLKNVPDRWRDTPPQIDAADRTRAVLGYMHGNCGHCHNDSGPLALLELSLLQSASNTGHSQLRTLATLINRASDTPLDELNFRVVPGEPERSVLLARLHTRNPYTRMPPLGASLPDTQAIALIRNWIEHDIPTKEISP